MATSSTDKRRMDLLGLVVVSSLMLAIFVWSYWHTIRDLYIEWQHNDDYSAGQLVPLVAVFLVWWDRRTLGQCVLRPCWWGGIALLGLAMTTRAFGLLFLFDSAERYSLVLAMAGLVLMVAGRQVFWGAGWILLLLLLMIPLPGSVHNRIAGPLQSLATDGSVFLLEAFGVRVSQQGHVMTLNQNIPLAVAEACSGLRMLMAFVIVAAFIAYMVKRPRSQKAILLASSIPVGVICNIVRIFATAVFMLLISPEFAEKFFHDFAGLVMMPIAVLLMFGELWLMKRLTIPDSPPSSMQP
jgi:exosortase